LGAGDCALEQPETAFAHAVSTGRVALAAVLGEMVSPEGIELPEFVRAHGLPHPMATAWLAWHAAYALALYDEGLAEGRLCDVARKGEPTLVVSFWRTAWTAPPATRRRLLAARQPSELVELFEAAFCDPRRTLSWVVESSARRESVDRRRRPGCGG
jgi:hypothetical protein